MTPEYALRLEDERAAELREARHLEEAQAGEAVKREEGERRRIQAERFSGQWSFRDATELARGLLDHLKTWRYKVAASPNQCIEEFAKAFGRAGASS